MYQIQNLNSNAGQKQKLFLPDGSFMTFSIVFKPMQFGWFIRDLTYGDFNVKNVRVVTSPNILYQFKNVIPFGMACYAEQNREPMFAEDFESGKCNLFILSEEEVEELAEIYSG